MRASIAFVVLTLGCGPVVDDADGGIADTTGDATTGASDGSITTSAGTVDDGTPPPQTTSPPDPSATMSSTSPPEPSDTGVTDDVTTDAPGTDEEDATTASPKEPCAPQGDDDACRVCRKAACCTEISECEASEDCECVLVCLDALEMPEPSDAMNCAVECSVDFFEIVVPIMAIATCQQENCAESCGG